MAKSKFKEVHCNYCKKVTKMRILKEPEDNKGWFECQRCRHSFLVDLSIGEAEKEELRTLPDKTNCTPYSPFIEYSIGDSIFHPEWDDVGIVEAKRRLSNGQSSVIVRFINNGTKTLIENLKADEEDVSETESLSSDVDPSELSTENNPLVEKTKEEKIEN